MCTFARTHYIPSYQIIIIFIMIIFRKKLRLHKFTDKTKVFVANILYFKQNDNVVSTYFERFFRLKLSFSNFKILTSFGTLWVANNEEYTYNIIVYHVFCVIFFSKFLNWEKAVTNVKNLKNNFFLINSSYLWGSSSIIKILVEGIYSRFYLIFFLISLYSK